MSSIPSIETQATPQDLDTKASPRPWLLGKANDPGYSQTIGPCHIWTAKGPGCGLIATTAPWCEPYDQQRADAAFIVEAVNAFDSNKALIEQLYAKTTCCCGDDVTHSDWSGHSPKSMYDHALDGANERIAELEALLTATVRERENYNGMHQAAVMEIERLKAALGRIARGGTAVLISAALDECPVNPDVLQQIVTDANAALAVE